MVVPSRAMRDVLREYGVQGARRVIPTGIELERLSGGNGPAFRQRHGIPPERPVLVHVGRVAFEKNIDFLLRMLVRVRADVPDVLLVIAGEGPSSGHLRRLARRLALERNVLFLGYLDRRNVLLDCYCAGDAFVFASRTETQGLVLLEAMALGLPVVSTAVMGTRDILEAGRGALVPREDETDFAARVADLLRDPALRARLSREARDTQRNGARRGWPRECWTSMRVSCMSLAAPPSPDPARKNGIALTPFCDCQSRAGVDWRTRVSGEISGGTNMQDEVSAQRRRYPRFPFHRLASIMYDSGECSGTLLDASLNGALFEASSRLGAQLADCVLIIPFSRDPEEAIRLEAQVACRRGLRLGLHWARIDAESTMKLQRPVEMNLGTLRLLERPLLQPDLAAGESTGRAGRWASWLNRPSGPLGPARADQLVDRRLVCLRWCRVQRRRRRCRRRHRYIDNPCVHMTAGPGAGLGGGVQVRHLIVEVEIRREHLQERAFLEAAEEHRLVHLDVPAHQRADRTIVSRRAARGHQRGTDAHVRSPGGFSAVYAARAGTAAAGPAAGVPRRGSARAPRRPATLSW